MEATIRLGRRSVSCASKATDRMASIKLVTWSAVFGRCRCCCAYRLFCLFFSCCFLPSWTEATNGFAHQVRGWSKAPFIASVFEGHLCTHFVRMIYTESFIHFVCMIYLYRIVLFVLMPFFIFIFPSFGQDVELENSPNNALVDLSFYGLKWNRGNINRAVITGYTLCFDNNASSVALTLAASHSFLHRRDGFGVGSPLFCFLLTGNKQSRCPSQLHRSAHNSGCGTHGDRASRQSLLQRLMSSRCVVTRSWIQGDSANVCRICSLGRLLGRDHTLHWRPMVMHVLFFAEVRRGKAYFSCAEHPPPPLPCPTLEIASGTYLHQLGYVQNFWDNVPYLHVLYALLNCISSFCH